MIQLRKDRSGLWTISRSFRLLALRVSMAFDTLQFLVPDCQD